METVVDLMHELPTLFHHRQSWKTETVSTVKLNRKFIPKDLSVKKKGDNKLRTSRAGMLAMSWFDKKPVNILSTVHKGDEIVNLPPIRRGEIRRKPLCFVDYNGGMKGVNISDQLEQSYSAARKTNKWYVKLLYGILDMAIINAHNVLKWLGGKMTQLDFHLQLIAD